MTVNSQKTGRRARDDMGAAQDPVVLFSVHANGSRSLVGQVNKNELLIRLDKLDAERENYRWLPVAFNAHGLTAFPDRIFIADQSICGRAAICLNRQGILNQLKSGRKIAYEDVLDAMTSKQHAPGFY